MCFQVYDVLIPLEKFMFSNLIFMHVSTMPTPWYTPHRLQAHWSVVPWISPGIRPKLPHIYHFQPFVTKAFYRKCHGTFSNYFISESVLLYLLSTFQMATDHLISLPWKSTPLQKLHFFHHKQKKSKLKISFLLSPHLPQIFFFISQ